MATAKICCVPGCPTIATHRSRCTQHARELRATKTNTADSPQHRATRARLLPDAIGQPCALCGDPMTARADDPHGQALDLDHTVPLRDDPTSKGDRIVHARCNRSAGGKLAHA